MLENNSKLQKKKRKRRKRVPVKVIIKYSIIAYFFSFPLPTHLKSNCVTQVYDYIIKHMTHSTVIYLTVITQKKWMGTKLVGVKK